MDWCDLPAGTHVLPSVYAADFLRLGEQVRELLDAGASVFHFDIGDGHFVPPVTIGPVVLRSLAPLVHAAGGLLDCHLMVTNPAHHLPELAESGADSVTFHVEVTDDVAAVAAVAREHGLGVGVACNPATAIEELAAAARATRAELALCMSIVPGYSGQPFQPAALERLARLRALLPQETRVQVDGGINAETSVAAAGAGADLLVAGSSVFYADHIVEAYRGLVAAVS